MDKLPMAPEPVSMSPLRKFEGDPEELQRS